VRLLDPGEFLARVQEVLRVKRALDRLEHGRRVSPASTASAPSTALRPRWIGVLVLVATILRI
jgi:hypothetical protein